jgi:predicted Zn-dependent protease
MLRCCRHEEAVAAVLAHEIGHVQSQHGLQAIKKSRITSALSTIAIEGTKQFGSETLASLTSTFEDSITDITSTLINNGYSRSFERQADKAAVTIMERVGYNPHGLVDMLEVMQTKLKPGGLDFAKTHPSPASRIKDIAKLIGSGDAVHAPRVRQIRFKKALGKI